MFQCLGLICVRMNRQPNSEGLCGLSSGNIIKGPMQNVWDLLEAFQDWPVHGIRHGIKRSVETVESYAHNAGTPYFRRESLCTWMQRYAKDLKCKYKICALPIWTKFVNWNWLWRGRLRSLNTVNLKSRETRRINLISHFAKFRWKQLGPSCQLRFRWLFSSQEQW